MGIFINVLLDRSNSLLVHTWFWSPGTGAIGKWFFTFIEFLYPTANSLIRTGIVPTDSLQSFMDQLCGFTKLTAHENVESHVFLSEFHLNCCRATHRMFSWRHKMDGDDVTWNIFIWFESTQYYDHFHIWHDYQRSRIYKQEGHSQNLMIHPRKSQNNTVASVAWW